MGKKETVDAMVEGGKANAGPPIGSSLGPLKVNVAQIVSKINEKTSAFKGMKVPVKIIVDTETKEFEIEVGTPPASQLIKKELGIELGSGEPNISKVGVLAIEQVIKIAKMKEGSILANDFKSAVKTIVGSCNSMGVLIEEKEPKEVIKEIDAGKYDSEIKSGKTEADADKLVRFAQIGKKLDETKKAREKEKEAAKAAEQAAQTAAAAAAPATGTTPASQGKPGAARSGAAPATAAPAAPAAGKPAAAKAQAKK